MCLLVSRDIVQLFIDKQVNKRQRLGMVTDAYDSSTWETGKTVNSKSAWSR